MTIADDDCREGPQGPEPRVFVTNERLSKYPGRGLTGANRTLADSGTGESPVACARALTWPVAQRNFQRDAASRKLSVSCSCASASGPTGPWLIFTTTVLLAGST